jgi:putative oxidoreductase
MGNANVLLAGRALMSAVFLVAGVRKIMFWGGQVAYFTKLGFPAPEFFTVVAIVVEIGAGLALLAGWKAKYAAWLLALFVLVATFMAHRFWEFDAAQAANQMNHFLKNLAIIGGLLFVAAFGPGRLAVDKS